MRISAKKFSGDSCSEHFQSSQVGFREGLAFGEIGFWGQSKPIKSLKHPSVHH